MAAVITAVRVLRRLWFPSGYYALVAVTRDDVARQAGVSTAVVSYVLNNGPRPVSANARARVLAAVAELGYQRDGVARMLALGRSSSIGLVVPDIGLPYFGRVTQAISSLASHNGYQLLIGTTDWNVERERSQIQALAERRVEGIVLMSVDPLQDFAPLASLGIPVAVVDRPEFAVDGAALAAGHLIEHGYREIAMISGSHEFLASRRRRDGWRRAMTAAELAAGDALVVAADYSQRGGYEAAAALLDAHPGLEAIFAESDLQALGALRLLRDRGIAAPKGMALATADASEFGEFSVPSLTTLSKPAIDVAQAAVDAILSDQVAAGVAQIDVLGFELVRRESCGCRPD